MCGCTHCNSNQSMIYSTAIENIMEVQCMCSCNVMTCPVEPCTHAHVDAACCDAVAFEGDWVQASSIVTRMAAACWLWNIQMLLSGAYDRWLSHQMVGEQHPPQVVSLCQTLNFCVMQNNAFGRCFVAAGANGVLVQYNAESIWLQISRLGNAKCV